LLVGSFSQNYYQSLLWIVPLPAGSPRRLADITGQDGTWFPDGTRILYAYLPCLYLIYVSASVRIGCYSTRSTLNFAGDSCRTNSNPFASLPMPITVFGSIANCFSSVVFVFQ